MNPFKAYLSGKMVALVGPANTLLDQEMGRFIDAHDVVVRINHSWPLPEEHHKDIGTRTDIIYHNLNPKKQTIGETDVSRMCQDGITWIVSTHPARRARYVQRMRQFKNVNKGRIKFRAIPIAVKKILRPRVGSANGGFIAMVDLLRFPIKQLYVTGFSFYETDYLNYPNYKPEFIQNALNHHNQRRHKKFLAKLLTRDKRVDVDPYIRRQLLRLIDKRSNAQNTS